MASDMAGIYSAARHLPAAHVRTLVIQRLSRNHDAQTRKSCATKHLGPQFAHQRVMDRPLAGHSGESAVPVSLGERGTGQSGPPHPGGSVMAIRPNNEERGFGADRERQREISNESGRTARATGGESAGRNEGAAESPAPPASEQSRLRLDGSHQAARDREQGRTRGAPEGHGPRVRLERGPRRGPQGRRHGEPQPRAHGRHRPSWRRSARRQPRRATSAERRQRSRPPQGNAQRFQSDREVGLSANTNGQPATNPAGRARLVRAATRSAASVGPPAPTSATSSVRSARRSIARERDRPTAWR